MKYKNAVQKHPLFKSMEFHTKGDYEGKYLIKLSRQVNVNGFWCTVIDCYDNEQAWQDMVSILDNLHKCC